jgi:dTDP-4-amino-4,6-dideoxygalactose transaminase
MSNPFDIVHEFERVIAEYSDAPYSIATDCCSHAIFLSAIYYKKLHGSCTVKVPKNTYVSAPSQLIHAGFDVEFSDIQWSGVYPIEPTNIIDGAPRFTKDMYIKGTYHCLSFQFKKILSTGRGGMILTDDKDFYDWAQRAVHDGRDMSVPYEEDTISVLGYHMFMTPEAATLGLENFKKTKSVNKDVADSNTYPDISYIKEL